MLQVVQSPPTHGSFRVLQCSRAFSGPTTDRVLAEAWCAVAVYAGGVRLEALRAAVAEPEVARGAGAVARAGDAGSPDATPH